MPKKTECVFCAVRIDLAEHICPFKFYEWTVKIRVNATWVADGFDLDADRLHTMVSRDLTHAYEHEIKTEIVKAPDAVQIAHEQGYKSVQEKKAARKR